MLFWYFICWIVVDYDGSLEVEEYDCFGRFCETILGLQLGLFSVIVELLLGWSGWG